MSFVLQRSLLACLVTLGAVHVPAAGAQEVTVKVGAVRSISTVAILWAVEKGYFKDYGIKVVTETLDTAANSIALLAQNQLQNASALRSHRHANSNLAGSKCDGV